MIGTPPTASANSGASGVAEAATAIVTVQRIDDGPLDFLDSLQHQLRDAVAALDVERCAWVGVEQDDFDLASVGRVDETRCVGDSEAVLQGITAARQHETCVSQIGRASCRERVLASV